MDERYLRFPRWLEASGLPEKINREIDPQGWLIFRRLVEEDLAQNLFPDWVDYASLDWPNTCGISKENGDRIFHRLGDLGLLEIRDLGETGEFFQYKIAAPLPIPRSPEEVAEGLNESNLPTNPQLWRYWEETKGETKYQKILRLYEKTCGLKMSSRIIEDLVELAEQHPTHHLEKAFAAAREEGVTALGWIRKYLKRVRKDERVQKDWGRPQSLELPEGYSIPGGEGSDRES
ncbi:MAG: hypothetical protein KC978_06930 [Candidatus Omnitrophica bacterium]|nr:hypothetical protein [Candidatus Omnitrophota bacterium]